MNPRIAEPLDAVEDDVDLGLAAAGGAERHAVEVEPDQRLAGEQVEPEVAQLGEHVDPDAFGPAGPRLDRERESLWVDEEQRVVLVRRRRREVRQRRLPLEAGSDGAGGRVEAVDEVRDRLDRLDDLAGREQRRRGPGEPFELGLHQRRQRQLRDDREDLVDQVAQVVEQVPDRGGDRGKITRGVESEQRVDGRDQVGDEIVQAAPDGVEPRPGGLRLCPQGVGGRADGVLGRPGDAVRDRGPELVEVGEQRGDGVELLGDERRCLVQPGGGEDVDEVEQPEQLREDTGEELGGVERQGGVGRGDQRVDVADGAECSRQPLDRKVGLDEAAGAVGAPERDLGRVWRARGTPVVRRSPRRTRS